MTYDKGPPHWILAFLGLLYLVQGIPYGMQDKFIPILLKNNGMDYSSVSAVKGLLIPWVTKGLWAPFIQLWGNDTLWLVGSLLLLALSAIAGSMCDISSSVFGIGTVLLFLNIGCAVQDVVVDGLAIKLLRDDQLGLINSLQVVLYKVGSAVGGTALLYLMSLSSWHSCLLSVATLYFLTAAYTAYSGIKNEKVKHTKPKKHKSMSGEVLEILKGIYFAEGSLWLSFYVFFYKMGERGAAIHFPLFLLDYGISMSDLAFWNGIISQSLSILGSVYGGYICSYNKKNSLNHLLINHSIFRFLFILAQCICTFYITTHSSFYWLGIIGFCGLSFSSGVISILTFTLMMQYCKALPPVFQTSHYSVFASIEIAGKLAFATSSGFIVDALGISFSFVVFTFLSIIPLFSLAMKKHSHKYAID